MIAGRDTDKDQKRCHVRETTLTFFVVYLFSLEMKSYACHDPSVRDDLIIFGRDIYQVK